MSFHSINSYPYDSELQPNALIFFHQAPTDTQHSLNHDKHSLCTVTDVAWRPASRRQAVHQFWDFPDFPSTLSPTSFLPLRTLITHNSNTIIVPTIQYLITMIHYSYIQIHSIPFQTINTDLTHSTLNSYALFHSFKPSIT